jgi:hypothetical protein
MTSKNRSRSRTRLLVAGSVTAAVALAAAGLGIANAATALPQLSFVVATPNVTAQRYVEGNQGYVYLDFGTHVIAGAEPFEIRAKRKSYKDPIVAQQIVTKKGKRTAVTLPAGMVTGWGGLKDFTSVSIKDASGKVVRSYTVDFCPGSYDSARTRRDAPPSTPYPQGCEGSNPFVLGAVWGIQAGWNAQVGATPQYTRDSPPMDLVEGNYVVSVGINKKYVDYFKIPAKQSSATVNLTVVTGEDHGGGPGAEPSGAPEPTPTSSAALAARANLARAAAKAAGVAPAAEHVHISEGDASRQVAAFSPDLRPPARRPVTLPKAAAAAQAGPRPDLRTLPAWGIQLQTGKDLGEGAPPNNLYLTFGATVWNGGTSPLVVDGFRRTGTELMDAYQYFFDAKGKQVGSVPAGTMEWDKREGHKHWHFTDFASYRLLGADKKLVVKSTKEAFCLANTDAVDYTLPNAKWRPSNNDLATSCGQNTSVAVREVLDIGNGDTYGQYLPGQSFDVTSLANGTYYIQVLANPNKKLTESNTANNSSLRKVTLSGAGATRKVTVASVDGIDG